MFDFLGKNIIQNSVLYLKYKDEKRLVIPDNAWISCIDHNILIYNRISPMKILVNNKRFIMNNFTFLWNLRYLKCDKES